MKKKIIIPVLFLTIFLFGCNQLQNNNLPYIIPLSQKEVVRPATSSYLVELYVVNPTPNTIALNLTYTYDNCLRPNDGRNRENIQLPKEGRLAFSKEFSHATRDQYGRLQDLRVECLQRPLPIHVELRDAGGDLRSSADFVVTLTSVQ